MSKFDAARANGEMKPTATLGMGTTDGKNYIFIRDKSENFEENFSTYKYTNDN